MNPINHVAIIMDGNGRWGIKYKNNRNIGHKAGLVTVEKIIKESLKQKIKFLTLYTFSTENWKRPEKEINFLFGLLENFIEKKLSILIKNKIKMKVIGEKKVFSKKTKNLLNFAESKTKKFNNLQLNIALNYGSKDEIIKALKSIVKKKENITEQNISNNLYTKNIPDPEILIRTGNTHRLSNFLLWQSAYTEIFFLKKLWPDLTYQDLEIINQFKLKKICEI